MSLISRGASRVSRRVWYSTRIVRTCTPKIRKRLLWIARLGRIALKDVMCERERRLAQCKGDWYNCWPFFSSHLVCLKARLAKWTSDPFRENLPCHFSFLPGWIAFASISFARLLRSIFPGKITIWISFRGAGKKKKKKNGTRQGRFCRCGEITRNFIFSFPPPPILLLFHLILTRSVRSSKRCQNEDANIHMTWANKRRKQKSERERIGRRREIN